MRYFRILIKTYKVSKREKIYLLLPIVTVVFVHFHESVMNLLITLYCFFEKGVNELIQYSNCWRYVLYVELKYRINFIPNLLFGMKDLSSCKIIFGAHLGRLPYLDIAINSDYPSMAVIVFLFEAIKFSMQESWLQSFKCIIQKW